MKDTLARFGIVVATIIAGPPALGLGAFPAQQDKKPDEAASVTGTWIMTLQGHQMGLVLEQEGEKVTGTLMAHGRELPLKGTLVDRALELVGVKQEGADEGSGGSHLGGSGGGPIVATLKDDGTLEGMLSTTKGRMPWTAERLWKR